LLFQVDTQVADIAKQKEQELTDNMKHGNQQTNIVKYMEQTGLLRCVGQPNEQLLYVEYGAGKGGLSHFVSQRLADKYKEEGADSMSKFVLIDRDARRNKKDRYMRASGFETERHMMDIADFDIVKYLSHIKETTAKDKQVRVVGIAKHLCGGATDLTLTSFKKLPNETLEGLAIATCCHHSCDTLTYVNLPFVEAEIGLQPMTNAKFCHFVRCSSWAVDPRASTEKRAAGFKVKRMLDLGRILFMSQQASIKVEAVQYCDAATESPESTLILASLKQ
jgi:tRNA:m4X modification enzyme